MASPLLPSVTTSIASFRPALFPTKSQTNCFVGNGRHSFAVGGSRLLLLPCKAKHGDHNTLAARTKTSQIQTGRCAHEGPWKDDPRNFWNQANVHCAYCEGSYHYTVPIKYCFIHGIRKELQVHSSWLFYPFHRWYLYFHERILADLIDDPTFALPFWNWDAPEGMYMPAIFEDDHLLNPLYDANRNAKHRVPGTVLDLNYGKDDNPDDNDTIIRKNLFTMHSQMLSISSTDWCSFFGDPLVWMRTNARFWQD
ncbi:polyphenol oxidase I chloroplastic-like [Prunus yedoensis var. nudiflora]|uniref:Polyphenol oxidase I chloroplastic-like n=1 Tax=Prunus yedoensis var. nudiflora TaxID=2094558 RepID=A0A314UEM1_PRUYE|nr:polyphenol oxidase I chloroplastic-like [Prunus yedoensis var. nudiflora]